MKKNTPRGNLRFNKKVFLFQTEAYRYVKGTKNPVYEWQYIIIADHADY